MDCAAGAGTSVREQEWLSDGDWDSWKKAVAHMRTKKRVRCAGWPRSQEMGACLEFDNGKSIHADHWVPLRAGGINDASNFQPLCNACNIRKNDHRPAVNIRRNSNARGRSISENCALGG